MTRERVEDGARRAVELNLSIQPQRWRQNRHGGEDNPVDLGRVQLGDELPAHLPAVGRRAAIVRGGYGILMDEAQDARDSRGFRDRRRCAEVVRKARQSGATEVRNQRVG